MNQKEVLKAVNALKTGSDADVGLTLLRKLAKSIGKDHELAQTLWRSKDRDLKTVGLLIDDPKKITREQAEAQVEEVGDGLLAHVFSSCSANLAKTSFVVELALDWIDASDELRRRCGYGLIYEISKNFKKSTPSEDFFHERVAEVSARIGEEGTTIQMAMLGALLSVGKRSKDLNAASLKIARKVGPLRFDDTCDPFDLEKHLTSDYVKKKLGIA